MKFMMVFLRMYLSNIVWYIFSYHRESKRKTAAVVALRNDERVFGEAASSVVSKMFYNPLFYIDDLLTLWPLGYQIS